MPEGVKVGGWSLYPSGHLLYYLQKPHFEKLFWENKKWTKINVHFEKTLIEIQNKNADFCIQSIMLRFSKFPEKPDCITFYRKTLGFFPHLLPLVKRR
jgi:hypothetical protein